MMIILICSLLAVLLLGWVLFTNRKDRKTFERELEKEFPDEPDDCS
jgi:hypothetical protein